MHFKKAPISHKLGVLYVVDSVTRKWVEQAKSAGQHVDGSASDGTFAAGVHRVTELMPVLMNDMLQLLPEGQKVRLILENSWSACPPCPIYASNVVVLQAECFLRATCAFIFCLTLEGLDLHTQRPRYL